MGRRNEHSREELRDMVLKAATQLIAEEGLSALSARRIATQIGYSASSLYNIFSSFDDIVMQVNEHTLMELSEILAQVARAHDDPQRCIQALGRAYITFAITHRQRWRAIFDHRMPDGQRVSETFAHQVAVLFGWVQAPLAQLVPCASEAEITLAAHALWGGVHGIATLWIEQKLQAGGLSTAEELVEHLIAQYLRGLTSSLSERPIELNLDPRS